MISSLNLKKNKRVRKGDRNLYRIPASKVLRSLGQAGITGAELSIHVRNGMACTTESTRWLRTPVTAATNKYALVNSYMTSALLVAWEQRLKFQLQYTNLNNHYLDVEVWTWNAVRDFSVADGTIDAADSLDACVRAHWQLAGGNQADVWAGPQWDPSKVPGISNTIKFKYLGRGRILPGESKMIISKRIFRRYARQDCMQYFVYGGLTNPWLMSAGEWGVLTHVIPPIISGSTSSGTAANCTIVEDLFYDEKYYMSYWGTVPSWSPAVDNGNVVGTTKVFHTMGVTTGAADPGNSTVT